MSKLHFRPIAWADMPMSARKTWLRINKKAPGQYWFNGWEWFRTYAEPDKVYSLNRGMRWFVADNKG